jgi:hypothetical protein
LPKARVEAVLERLRRCCAHTVVVKQRFLNQLFREPVATTAEMLTARRTSRCTRSAAGAQIRRAGIRRMANGWPRRVLHPGGRSPTVAMQQRNAAPAAADAIEVASGYTSDGATIRPANAGVSASAAQRAAWRSTRGAWTRRARR